MNDAYADLSGIIGETCNFYLCILNGGDIYCDASELNNVNTYGISSSNYTYLELTDGVEIHNKDSGYGIRITNYASGYLDDEISFCNNDQYDIQAESNAVMDVDYIDEWTDCPPPVVEQSGGAVYITGNCQVCSLGKSMASARNGTIASESQLINDEPGMAEFRQAMAVYHNMMKSQRDDLKDGMPYDAEKYRNQYQTIIEMLKTIVNEHNGAKSSFLAMAKIVKCYWELGESRAVYDYLNEKSKDDKMKLHASRLLIFYYLKLKDYNKALDNADRLITEFADNENVSNTLHTKGLIYKYYLKDYVRAIEIFNQVISQYPNSTLFDECQYELAEMGQEIPKINQVKEDQSDSAIMSYPNPFNATIKISYVLPEFGQVRIVIFNTLGQKVRTLVDDKKESGQYEIIWDGLDDYGNIAATGLYFTTLTTTNKTQTLKILLVR